MKKLLITLFIIGAGATIFSCKENLNKTSNIAINNISDSVKDIDGNVYHTITIGTQTWMKENLKTTHYRDSSLITEIEDNSAWASNDTTSSQTPAWCYYNNNSANNVLYGKLYNWYVIGDSRKICPKGWHVPSDSEWKVLSNYLGGDDVAGGKMKSITLWTSPNTDADNSSGFTGLPGGYRYEKGEFVCIGLNGYWWSSKKFDTYNAYWFCYLYSNNGTIHMAAGAPQSGFSIRCVKD